MNKKSYFIIKNHIALAAFDAVGVEAVNLVTEVQSGDDNHKPSLFMALVSLSTIDVEGVIEWLKIVQKQAELAQEPMLLAIHLSPLILSEPQQRVEFLHVFSELADSIVLVPQLAGDSSAQALARFPQFLLNLAFKSGIINLDFNEIKNHLHPDVAFFGYGSQSSLEDSPDKDMSALMAEIHQQWCESYLPHASVQAILACIEGCDETGLETYTAVGEQLELPHEICKPVKNMSIAIGLTIKDDTKSADIQLGVLFLGLNFSEYSIFSTNQ